jgi:hypothetical protein
MAPSSCREASSVICVLYVGRPPRACVGLRLSVGYCGLPSKSRAEIICHKSGHRGGDERSQSWARLLESVMNLVADVL